jgi:dolichol-phosphate mannosyltransferase
MNLVIVIPTYNEAANIEAITAELLALPAIKGERHILIVDDDSPDGTGDIAEALAQRNPGKVSVLHRYSDPGLGRAYIDGFRKALDMGADVVVQMDADFSHSPQYIPTFLDILEEHEDVDIVVGSRYVAGGQLDEHWSWWRRFLSWWANAIYTRLILNLNVKDGTAGFKAWRKETLEGIGLERIDSNGYVFQVEMAYVAERLGYKTMEIPIYFEDRRIGKSKMSIPVKIEAAIRTWQIRMKHKHLTPADRLSAASEPPSMTNGPSSPPKQDRKPAYS